MFLNRPLHFDRFNANAVWSLIELVQSGYLPCLTNGTLRELLLKLKTSYTPLKLKAFAVNLEEFLGVLGQLAILMCRITLPIHQIFPFFVCCPSVLTLFPPLSCLLSMRTGNESITRRTDKVDRQMQHFYTYSMRSVHGHVHACNSLYSHGDTYRLITTFVHNTTRICTSSDPTSVRDCFSRSL